MVDWNYRGKGQKSLEMEDLPDDILLHVFSHLRYEELCLAVRMTCWRWRRLSHDAELWRYIDVPEHFNDKRFLMWMEQVHTDVESIECSRCDSLTFRAFQQLAKLEFPRLRHLAIPIGCTYPEIIYSNLSKACPELRELENVSPTFSDAMYPLRCQAFFPKLRATHDKPMSTYGRIRTTNIIATNEKRQKWIDDLTHLAASCPDILSYRCRRGFEYINDDGLEKVAILFPDVRFLELHYCCITDDGLNRFFEHNKADIKEIILDQPGDITDKGLEVIAKYCENLENLKLSRCIKITNEGVAHLVSKCCRLKELHLNNTMYAFDKTPDQNTDFNNECLKNVGINCPELVYFRVFYSNQITQQGMHGLAQSCRFLQGLMLYECPKIDDACLETLLMFPFLKALVMVNCEGITAKGIIDLVLLAPCLIRLTLFSNTRNFHGDMSQLAEDTYNKIDTHSDFRPSVIKKINLKGVGGAFIQLVTVLCPLLHTLDLREANIVSVLSIVTVLRNAELLQILDVQSVPTLDDSFLLAVARYGMALRKLGLGATVAKLSNEALIEVIVKCPSLTTVTMDTENTDISEERLVAAAKKHHGGCCYLFVDPECRDLDSNSRHRYVELHFTAIKYVNSVSLHPIAD